MKTVLGVLIAATVIAVTIWHRKPTVAPLPIVTSEKTAAAAIAEVQRIQTEELSKDIIERLNDGSATAEDRERVRQAFERKNAVAQRWLEYQLAQTQKKVSDLENGHERNLEGLREELEDLGVIHAD